MYRLLLLLFILSSCTKEELINPTPCIGDCETLYRVLYKNQPVSINNGYYEITWDDLDYFQIEGNLSTLNDQYVINDVPLIEANFDSDYWVIMDSIQYQTPMYSYLGWFNDQTLNTPISIGPHIYTMVDLANINPPLNIVGYQIPKHFCFDCPYASSIVGTHSKYNYNPKQNIFLDNEMVGDTINIFIETIFNTDMGNNEIINDNLKIIIL